MAKARAMAKAAWGAAIGGQSVKLKDGDSIEGKLDRVEYVDWPAKGKYAEQRKTRLHFTTPDGESKIVQVSEWLAADLARAIGQRVLVTREGEGLSDTRFNAHLTRGAKLGPVVDVASIPVVRMDRTERTERARKTIAPRKGAKRGR